MWARSGTRPWRFCQKTEVSEMTDNATELQSSVRDEVAQWLFDAPAVVLHLQQLQARLRDAGYAHTAVPHHTVRVYHRDGAAIEVIWSRCRADGSEIERLAVHFEIGRGPAGWRILGVQAAPTSSSSLDALCPPASLSTTL